MAHSDSPAWQLVRAAAAAVVSSRMRLDNGRHYALDGGVLKPVPSAGDGGGELVWDGGWRSLRAEADEQVFLDLYLPLAASGPTAPLVIGQLGQSIDGFIATASGHSHYVTGEASLLHLHRLRALSHCVVVGAGTVAADDPRLTTRLVSGDNPARVVLDPHLRLPIQHRVFSDGEARTLRVRAHGVPLPAARTCATVEDIELPATAGRLHLQALLAELRDRGHFQVLVEGGGITLSAFHAAGLLDRMHIVVAPFLMGEGRPGLRVPSPARLQDCLRPPPRVYALGDDVLFDCDLRAASITPDGNRSVIRRLL